jgi:hypothetical protein
MKIQKRFLRKHKNKDYYKCVVNIPSSILKESGLDYGEDVEIKAEKDKIILKKKGKKE